MRTARFARSRQNTMKIPRQPVTAFADCLICPSRSCAWPTVPPERQPARGPAPAPSARRNVLSLNPVKTPMGCRFGLRSCPSLKYRTRTESPTHGNRQQHQTTTSGRYPVHVPHAKTLCFSFSSLYLRTAAALRALHARAKNSSIPVLRNFFAAVALNGPLLRRRRHPGAGGSERGAEIRLPTCWGA